MTDDKHIIAVLLDALEDAHVTRMVLTMMIMTYRDHHPEIGDWERDLENLKIEIAPAAKKQFLALREAVRRSGEGLFTSWFLPCHGNSFRITNWLAK